jgi:hypothetical protein
LNAFKLPASRTSNQNRGRRVDERQFKRLFSGSRVCANMDLAGGFNPRSGLHANVDYLSTSINSIMINIKRRKQGDLLRRKLFLKITIL